MLFNCTATAKLKESPKKGKPVASIPPTNPLIPSRKFLLTMFRLAFRVLHPLHILPPPSPFQNTFSQKAAHSDLQPIKNPALSPLA